MDDHRKHPGGRPRKYDSPEQMQEAIDAYFDDCVEAEKHPTVCGLALALGFIHRQALLNYEGYSPGFHDTIKRAKTKIEQHLEDHLYNGAVTGAIFNLKNNFGWKDKNETEHSGSLGFQPLVVNVEQKK